DGIDAVIDLVNRDADGFASMAALVRSGGSTVSAVGGAGELTEIDGVTVANIGGNPAHLPALATMVREGRLRIPIARTYPLRDAAQALQDFTSAHTVGKLVITMP